VLELRPNSRKCSESEWAAYHTDTLGFYMTENTCPRCTSQGRLLVESSKDAVVDYFRCDRCGHVWNRDKKNPNAPPRDVTIRVTKKL
jgi:transposase-like protein